MSKPRSIAWAAVVALVTSGFIHSTDADVGGTGALLEPSAFGSVGVFGLLILLPILLCQYVLRRRGWLGFVIVGLAVAMGMGLALALAGSTAETASQWLVSFLGSSALFGLVLGISAAPAIRSSQLRNDERGARTA